MEDTIEMVLGAPKANKVQPRTPSGSQRQKQKQEQSIGETTHLVEIVLSVMDELYNNIQEQRAHNDALQSEVSEIKTALAQPRVEEALRKEISEVKAELARVVALLKSTQAQAQAQAQIQA
jgi:Tfp pilus assembly protein PilN